MGRFLSPDWSEDPDAVPYADFTNPQSLNLYGYVDNNPLGYRDPTGHVNEGCTSSGAPDDNGTIVVTINCPQRDCGLTGGTHVEGHLTGYNSTDPDGTINEFYSNAYGTQNGSQNGMSNPSTGSGFWCGSLLKSISIPG